MKDTDTKIALQKIAEDLIQISKFAKLAAAGQMRQMIEELALSDERKRIWSHCNGRLTRAQIEEEAEVSHQTASVFLDMCVRLGLIEEEKRKGGHPMRVVDYIPDRWKEVVKTKRKKAEEKKIAAAQPSLDVSKNPRSG